jgi:membrane-bound lytic murein transglycosylase D
VARRFLLAICLFTGLQSYCFSFEPGSDASGFFSALVSKFKFSAHEVRGFQDKSSYKFSIASIANSVPLLQLYSQILDEYHVPAEFSLLPLIESANNPFAKSHKNAVGLWQFIPTTGEKHGLKVSSTVDDRKNVIRSTTAAAQHLSYLHAQLHDWVLVIAAYNCGLQCVINARKKSSNDNLQQIISKTPKETRDYVQKFFSLRDFVISNLYHPALSRFPDGIYLQRISVGKLVPKQPETPTDFDIFMQSHVARFLNHGIENPIDRNNWNQPTTLVIPTALFRDFFSENKVSFRHPAKLMTATRCRIDSEQIYIVLRGESLSKIAAKLNTTVNTLRDLNGGIVNTRTGMSLKVC